jgi:alkylhydroperoxidase family enzyme
MENAFLQPPKKIPWFIRWGNKIAKKETGKDLLQGQLLAWFPKAALSSGLMEKLVAHGPKDMPERLLKLVRMTVSFHSNCPFCIDMNSVEYEQFNITEEEIRCISLGENLEEITSFSIQERLAIQYALHLTTTPVSMTREFFQELEKEFDEREIVILATTIAQVNYWTRLSQGLGIPPAGFLDACKTELFFPQKET